MKKKILLLNPTGKKGVIREYYCGHIAKGNYMWPPLDLLVLSGILSDHCDLLVIDSIVTGLSMDKAIKEILAFDPDLIISLVSAVSWKEDMLFLQKVSHNNDLKVLVSGDYAKAYPKKVLEENTHLDGVILDFTNCEIIDYINNENVNNCKNILTRTSVQKETVAANETFSYPSPRHELFPVRKYHLPHIQYHPYTTILTSFGCMFSCTYCPFERIPFKLRDLNNLKEELLHIRSLGIKELFFRDQCFGAHREHSLKVCEIIQKIDHPFSWSTEMRVDTAEEVLLTEMKNSGCHTVMYGIESASEEILKKHNKNITLQQTRKAFNLSKKLDIRTIAHVMMGMDGEDVSSQEDLINLCIELEPNYVSFNITAPLWNTSFREKLENTGRILDPKIDFDHNFTKPVWKQENLSTEQTCQFTYKAIKRFYIRPKYIFKAFLGAKSNYQRTALFREGLQTLFSNNKTDNMF